MGGYQTYYSSDDIYLKLKNDILTLALKPGQMISENEIANVYNVSRTPVKAAFIRLKGERFIDIIPQKGSFVTHLNKKYIQDCIYMRSVLEADALGAIMENGKAESVAAVLESNLESQRRLAASDEISPPAFFEVDSMFHHELFVASGREKIWDIIQDSQVYYMRFRILDTMTTARYHALCDEHAGIIASLREGDGQTLKTRVFDHLHGNLRTLASKIEGELKDYFTDF